VPPIHPFTHPIAIFLLVLLAGFSLASPAQSQELEPLYSADFENGLPDGWYLENGWQVVESEGGHALQGNGHAWARYNSQKWEDLLVRFRIKLDPGASLHANLRVQGESRYYIPINGYLLQISKQVGSTGFQNRLAEAPGLSFGWHWIEMAAGGNEVRVTVDGRPVMSWQTPIRLAQASSPLNQWDRLLFGWTM